MKKLLLMSLLMLFAGNIEFLAQTITGGGSGRLYRAGNSGADRSNDNGISQGSKFGPMADWSVDLTISEKTPTQAASDFVGPSHNGMGATGWGSFVAGAYNRASGAGAVAIGFHNAAGPLNSDESNIPTSGSPNTTNLGQFAVGYGTQATGHASFSYGQSTTASGSFSIAGGYKTIASDYGSFVIGSWNSSGSSATSATSFSTSAPAFVIGNGTASNAKSDAFKVMFNGDATLGNDLTVNGDITISSDARLKSNIVSLGATLSKLLLIDGKSYDMKGKEKIGVLAQEVKEVFPELVSMDENDMYSVNYQGLVPILINAIKEQDDKISRLENLVEQLILDKE